MGALLEPVDAEPAVGVRQRRLPGVLDYNQDLLERRPGPGVDDLAHEWRSLGVAAAKRRRRLTPSRQATGEKSH